MAMIIAHHIVINDFGLQGALKSGETIFSNSQLFVLMLINSFVIIGVNLFFLISGYFRIRFSKKKILLLILEIYIVYNVVTLIGILTKNVSLDETTIQGMLFPFDLYWFLSAYVGLMLLSPFLNKLIDSITRKHKMLIILVLLLFSFYAFWHDNGLVISGGYSLIWAIVMYVIGGLISKYKIKNQKGIYFYLLGAVLLALIVYTYYLFGDPATSWNLYKYNNIIVLTESVAIFVWVNSWNLKYKNQKFVKVISFLGKNTLMVYLLHSTCWLTMLRSAPTKALIDSGHFKLALILLPIYVLAIYVVCATVSVIYNVTVSKALIKVFSRLE